ncbi:MAG: peroxidase family protein [Hellea sp.]
MRGTQWKEEYVDGSKINEISSIKTFFRKIHKVQEKNRKTARDLEHRRAQHAKQQIGVNNAQFTVAREIPTELQNGLFQPGANFSASIRISNASGTIQADDKRDLRGFAVRVETDDDDETCYDLLMTNYPVSHARDAKQFMEFALAFSGNKIKALLTLLLTQGPFELFRMMRNIVKGTGRKVASLAEESFWSRSAFAINDLVAVRYALRPKGETISKAPKDASANYLRTDLVQRLAEGDIIYELVVQRFASEKTTPIENGGVEWKEKNSPFEVIAELKIPKQELESMDAQLMERDVGRLEFNPWITADDFRPLGSLNRARKFVYENSAALRSHRSKYIPPVSLGMRIYRPLVNVIFAITKPIISWHKLPKLIGSLNLEVFRNDLRKFNLFDTEEPREWPASRQPDPVLKSDEMEGRHPEGKFNDLNCPFMGAAGARFGRNTPLDDVEPHLDAKYGLLDPNPYDVAERILSRDTFKPATTLNLMAAAWIQFMIHGWVDHKKINLSEAKDEDLIKVPTDGGEWPENPMLIPKTQNSDTLKYGNKHIPVYHNEISHWWDGSQLYGSDLETQMKLRTGKDGKLKTAKIRDNEVLPAQKAPLEGVDATGFNDNYWLGLSLLHTLFTLEHNAICDKLTREYPTWNDDRIFQKARLIVSALLAKIHTVEWTPAILGHPALQVSMDANWWGLLGKKITDQLGRFSDSEAISGILGSVPDHHTAPYALTEEFSIVYFLHPLIPDEVQLHNIKAKTTETVGLRDIIGAKLREKYKKYSMEDLNYSFGVAYPGAISLKNFPNVLRPNVRFDGELQDLAVRDIVRARERNIPRYNDFREMLRLPRINSFAGLSANPEYAQILSELYDNDIDKVDTMVGMFAETPPQGFGFSDTAFRIFILMASRRLKSDRFFTSDYTPDMYTPEGIAWVQDNDMKSVMRRHYPALTPAFIGLDNIFQPWKVLNRD